jgi:hypothetical protein
MCVHNHESSQRHLYDVKLLNVGTTMLIDLCEQLEKKSPSFQTIIKEIALAADHHGVHVRIMSGLFCWKSPLQKWLKMRVRDLTKQAMIRGYTPCRLRKIVPDRVRVFWAKVCIRVWLYKCAVCSMFLGARAHRDVIY